MAEIAWSDSSWLSAKWLAAEAEAGAARWGVISGNSENLRMNSRSIRSFQRHTQSPAKPSAPREATAYRLPVLISASQLR